MSKKQFTIDYDVEHYGFDGDEPLIGDMINKYDDGKFLTCHFVPKNDIIGFTLGLRCEGYERVYDLDDFYSKLEKLKKELSDVKSIYEKLSSCITGKKYTIKKNVFKNTDEISTYQNGNCIYSQKVDNRWSNGLCYALECEGYENARDVNKAYEHMILVEEKYNNHLKQLEWAEAFPLVKN